MLILSILLLVGIKLSVTAGKRSPYDVLLDLRDEKLDINDPILNERESKTQKRKKSELKTKNISGFIFNDELARAGLIEPKERRKFEIILSLSPLVGGALFLIPSLIGSVKTTGTTFFMVSLGLGAGLIFRKYLLKSRKDRYIHSLTFFLPMVMERIVMAVQAGLDILPAINTVLSANTDKDIKKKDDPVTALLKIASKLTESGLSFERALKELATVIDSSAVRHAFLHLAVAQKEGGVLIMPLRELSDSTQLYYQESIEGEIAEMPVKATMPLLCTFAGLLVCFLTPPFLQILNILTENMPGR